MYAVSETIVEKKFTVKRSGITEKLLLHKKYCSISSTVLRSYNFSYYEMIARSQLGIMDYNSGTGLKQAQTKVGRDCFKQVYSKVTEVFQKNFRNPVAILKTFLKQQ